MDTTQPALSNALAALDKLDRVFEAATARFAAELTACEVRQAQARRALDRDILAMRANTARAIADMRAARAARKGV